MAFVDYRDPRPVYEQIVDYYEKLILTGAMQPDDRIPSVRQTAAEWSINPNTIQKAFSILEERGYIYAVSGRGNFVAETGDLLKQRIERFLEDEEKNIREAKAFGVKKSQMEDILNRVFGSDEA
jgi:GntR family transcriptional regulator